MIIKTDKITMRGNSTFLVSILESCRLVKGSNGIGLELFLE